MADVAVARLVCVDESGTTTKMTPSHAVAPKGQRAYGRVPRNHQRNTTLVAALSVAGVGAAMTRAGAMDRAAFLAWLGQGVLPTLTPGQIVVRDNLSVHRGAQVREVVEGYGCERVYLPAYSPDYMPIAGMFSKVKQALRRTAKRTQAELEEAIGSALARVTVADARGWFTHCGFPPPLPAQPL